MTGFDTPREIAMNPVVHFEMPYDDRERITRFYETVFGWKMNKLGPEMGNYVVTNTADADAIPDGYRGAINGGLFARDPKMPGQHPSVVVAVPDLPAAMEAVNGARGEVLGPPVEIPGIGLYVAFHDTEGNRVSMLQPRPR
jgi:predicted enzyme related to lactoylglutathione lyase